MSCARERDAGFTFIEIAISLSILLSFLAVMSGLLTSTDELSKTSHIRTRAVAEHRRNLESLSSVLRTADIRTLKGFDTNGVASNPMFNRVTGVDIADLALAEEEEIVWRRSAQRVNGVVDAGALWLVSKADERILADRVPQGGFQVRPGRRSAGHPADHLLRREWAARHVRDERDRGQREELGMIMAPTGEERGIMLVPVLFIVLILGGLSAAFLTEGLGDRTSLRHRETSLKALELAEAGLHRAQLEIFSLTDPDGDGIGTVVGSWGGGTYSVVCQQDATCPDRWSAVARGEVGLSVRRVEIGIRRRQQGYFVEGLFSKEELKLGGDLQTDSYDSRKGSWDSQATNYDAFGRHAARGGHVGSNEGIVAGGTAAVIRGNAIPGPGFETTLSGGPTILGDRVPRRIEIDLRPSRSDFESALALNVNATMTAPVTTTTAGNSGKPKTNPQAPSLADLGYDEGTMALSPKGDVILDGGTYFFTDLKLAAQGRLIVRGPSKIYVTGSIDLTGGGVINETGVAGDCQIYAHPYPLPAGFTAAKPSIKLAGGAKVAAAIYAPGDRHRHRRQRRPLRRRRGADDRRHRHRLLPLRRGSGPGHGWIDGHARASVLARALAGAEVIMRRRRSLPLLLLLPWLLLGLPVVGVRADPERVDPTPRFLARPAQPDLVERLVVSSLHHGSPAPAGLAATLGASGGHAAAQGLVALLDRGGREARVPGLHAARRVGLRNASLVRSVRRIAREEAGDARPGSHRDAGRHR